jgi:hypothetical protein
MSPDISNNHPELLDQVIGTPHNLTLAYSKQENALVKEVNRHLRAFIFESSDLASYRTHLPFVQRIINASVHATTGASLASLLFGNKVMLDKGILLPSPEVPSTLIPASTKVADMVLMWSEGPLDLDLTGKGKTLTD